ncbi:EutN/CcmL family microcompartment protein [Paenibacillus sp. GCM10023248]|uniref:EutN/CcmL family microcompartment protein n=1 Tax=unclassified Paenibacillus TaxID=185978 RepID=UPI002378ABF0|nr:EutN/CcmL family microcompartment protein [Paenibacillus sp. MAHUQ-63]MDD9271544.1 EutN/CcmL family microcompartment protein [Paenibacillus sp. MAHUQ-63]
MFYGKVIGSVWATQKEAGMDNLKLLVIQPMDFNGTGAGTPVVAADRIGAGIGERVIVSRGSPARTLFTDKMVPIDAMIVGIVDSFEVAKEAEEETWKSRR